MSGRLTQDAFENLFSQVRGFGNTHPSPVHFRNALRGIIVGQFIDVPASCNYEHDNSPHLLSFIKTHIPAGIHLSEIEKSMANQLDVLIGAAFTLDVCEGNGHYYLIG